MEPIGLREGADTAEILEFFNDLFDSFNGDSPLAPNQPPLRSVVTANSPHHKFWQDAKEKLLRMQYVDPTTLRKPKNPCQAIASWIQTIEGCQKLWELLKQKGFEEFKPKYISQDPLENFFGSIRALGSRNINPSCWQFTGNFKTLLICNVSKEDRQGSNCEGTSNEQLPFTLESLLANNEGVQNNVCIESDTEGEFENPFQWPSDPQDVNDTLGILTESIDKIQHELFKLPIVKDIVDKCYHCQLTFHRPQACQNKKSEFDLIYPKIIGYLNTVLPRVCYYRQITTVLIQRVLEEIQRDWIMCKHAEHQSLLHEMIVTIITNHFINNWCTMINRHLAGTSSHMKTYPMFVQAVQMHEKNLSRNSRSSSGKEIDCW